MEQPQRSIKKYIFDVDGTLTPSRREINSKFKEFFKQFCVNNNVYLVTGSDYSKTKEQMGEDLLFLTQLVYNCSGNSIWSKGKEIYKDEWKLPNDCNLFLLDKLHSSKFKVRTGQHFDHRPGLCNFSIVGRNADTAQRKKYFSFDELNKERRQISEEFNRKFKSLEATVAGETGIDITQKGKGKHQILKNFDENDDISFFGDKTMEGGNDYTISRDIKKLPNGKVYQVESWEDTYEILKVQN